MLSRDLEFLELAYDTLNGKYFESTLIRPVITIQKTTGAFGHFTPWNSWKVSDKDFPELNLGAETLDRPIENTLATLQHEMIHQYCFVNEIKDTSSNGRYHNRRFKAEAEARGLSIGRAEGRGWTVTKPTAEFCAWVADTFRDHIKSCRMKEYCISTGNGNGADANGGNQASRPKPTSSTRKYTCPVCGMSVRATRVVKIKCMECDQQLQSNQAGDA
jgi:hypothetical protein